MQALLFPLLGSRAARGGWQKQKPEKWTCSSVSATDSLLKLLLFVLLQILKVTFPFEASVLMNILSFKEIYW